jgi:hypothetical protein
MQSMGRIMKNAPRDRKGEGHGAQPPRKIFRGSNFWADAQSASMERHRRGHGKNQDEATL